jgi:hypothetical protein
MCDESQWRCPVDKRKAGWHANSRPERRTGLALVGAAAALARWWLEQAAQMKTERRSHDAPPEVAPRRGLTNYSTLKAMIEFLKKVGT